MNRSKRVLAFLLLPLLFLSLHAFADQTCPNGDCDETTSAQETGLFSSGDSDFRNIEYYPTPIWGVWIEADPGYAAAVDYNGPAGNVGINVRYKRFMFSLQLTTVEEDDKNIKMKDFMTMDEPEQERYVKNLSLMFGWAYDLSWGLYSYNLGVSYVEGREENGNDFETAGIPLQAQIIWLPFDRYLGLGLKGFLNLNFSGDASNIGAVIVVALGKFR